MLSRIRKALRRLRRRGLRGIIFGSPSLDLVEGVEDGIDEAFRSR